MIYDFHDPQEEDTWFIRLCKRWITWLTWDNFKHRTSKGRRGPSRGWLSVFAPDGGGPWGSDDSAPAVWESWPELLRTSAREKEKQLWRRKSQGRRPRNLWADLDFLNVLEESIHRAVDRVDQLGTQLGPISPVLRSARPTTPQTG